MNALAGRAFLSTVMVAACLFLTAQAPSARAQAVLCSTSTVFTDRPTPAGSYWKLFLLMEVIVDPNGSTNQNGAGCYGPLQEVLSPDLECTWSTLITNTSSSVVEVDGFLPATDFAEPVDLVYTNATNEYLIAVGPEFVAAPETQSVLTGTTVTFSSIVIHQAGLQWRKDGADLSDSPRLTGSTNATLVLTGAQPSDAGLYTLVATDPSGRATTSSAELNVFKTLQLALSLLPDSPQATLSVANFDGTPLEPERVANIVLFTATDATQPFASWEVATNSLWLTNGVLQTVVPATDPARFWRVQESP